ncbi:MAG: 16S rRNA (cytosine(1402)-N(4))-methyltransferase RsmH [Candidatus Omnitrophota bacterium]
MGEKYLHRPVLVREVIDFLRPAPGMVIVDATIGAAGHAEEILKRITPGGTLVGIDRDIESLRMASERLRPFKGSFKLINKNFRYIGDILKDTGIKETDGILFDLGISSIQMESWERGFGIKNEGPLDMRMDRSQGVTAKDLVNTLSEEEISRLIEEFGEDRFHRRIARNIVRERRRGKISTTFELADVISRSLPFSRGRERIHPATRAFQAFRIAVNDELGSEEEALNQSPFVLKKGGRLCVISFHSLEDRISKNILRRFRSEGVFSVLTKKPLTPGEEELRDNPRSRSAKLRAAERL